MILAFDDIELDEQSGDLRRGGVSVALQPLSLKLLLHLVRNRHRVVSRDELLDALWPGVTVGDAALSSAVRDLRRALGDSGTEPRLVQTLRKRGFRFSAPLTEVRPAAHARLGDGGALGGAFVGRAELLLELEHELEAASTGHTRVVLLSGEAGIGKTRTAREAGEIARTRGFQVLEGWYPESQDAPAYWGWVQALRTLVAHEDDATLRTDLGSDALVLAQLLPDLADRLPELTRPLGSGARGSRLELFDAIARFLARSCGRAPRMLLLDDLHWADSVSLGLLEHVARADALVRLLVIGTYRDAGVDDAHPLSDTLSMLARLDHCTPRRLPGLEEQESRTLVRQLLGDEPDDRLVRAIWDRTDGNPFFVREVVRHLRDETRGQKVNPTSLEGIGIPATVQNVIGGRLARLPEACRETLKLASVIGERFDRDLLIAAADRSKNEIAEDLDTARRADLVMPFEPDGRSWHFGHGLVRDVVRSGLPVELCKLHARIAAALEGLQTTDEDFWLTARAYHLYAALPEVDTHRVRESLEVAASRAVVHHAHEEAATFYERALRLMEPEPDTDEHRLRLTLALASALHRGVGGEDAQKRFLQATALARELGDAEALARAAYGAAAAGGFIGGGIEDTAPWRSLIEEALAALGDGDSALRARLLARLVEVDSGIEGLAEREQQADSALAMARRVKDPEALAASLYARHLISWRPGQKKTRLALLDEMVPAADRSGNYGWPLDARRHRATALLVLGDLAGSELELRAVERLAEDGKLVFYRAWALLGRGLHALREGRFEAMGPLHDEVRDLGAANRAVALARWVQAAVAGSLLRRPIRAEPPAPELVDSAKPSPALRVSIAWFATQRGDANVARRELSWLAADGFAQLSRDGYSFAALAALLAEVAAGVGDASSAAWLYDTLRPLAGCNVVYSEALYLGCASRYLALLARSLDRPVEAERHFEEALEADARMEAHPWRALAQCDYAELLMERNVAGHVARARGLAQQAESAASRMGMLPLLGRAQALLARCEGVR